MREKPKGNGIKDGSVSWVCVYAVVFWMLRFPEAILHVYFIFLNGLSVLSCGVVTLWFGYGEGDCYGENLFMLKSPRKM